MQLSVAWLFRVDHAAAKKSCSGFLFCFFFFYFIFLEWLEGNLVDRVQQCISCSAKQCKLLRAESTLVGLFSQCRLSFVFTFSACAWVTFFFPASLFRIRLATHPVKASAVFCLKYVTNPALHGLEIHRMSLDLRNT